MLDPEGANVKLTRTRTVSAIATLASLMLLSTFIAPTAVGAAGSGSYRDCSHIDFEPNARMHRCSLPDSTIIGLDLHGISFAWSDLSRVNAGCDPDLPRTNLTGARIARAILVDGKLCDAILTGADLHGSDFSRASFEDATATGANVSWAILTGATAAFASFVDANLSNASWRDGAAIGARFDGADLHRIDLRRTNLRASSFVGADLRYAQLAGVDFTDADLTGANWRRATGIAAATFSNTTCPDGTNSDANGGTCAGH